MKKKNLFKKCLLIRIVLYRVCNFKISGMMTSVFNVSPKTVHFTLFPKYCVFQLVFCSFFFLLYLYLLALLLCYCHDSSFVNCMEFMNFLISLIFPRVTCSVVIISILMI